MYNVIEYEVFLSKILLAKLNLISYFSFDAYSSISIYNDIYLVSVGIISINVADFLRV